MRKSAVSRLLSVIFISFFVAENLKATDMVADDPIQIGRLQIFSNDDAKAVSIVLKPSRIVLAKGENKKSDFIEVKDREMTSNYQLMIMKKNDDDFSFELKSLDQSNGANLAKNGYHTSAKKSTGGKVPWCNKEAVSLIGGFRPFDQPQTVIGYCERKLFAYDIKNEKKIDACDLAGLPINFESLFSQIDYAAFDSKRRRFILMKDASKPQDALEIGCAEGAIEKTNLIKSSSEELSGSFYPTGEVCASSKAEWVALYKYRSNIIDINGYRKEYLLISVPKDKKVFMTAIDPNKLLGSFISCHMNMFGYLYQDIKDVDGGNVRGKKIILKLANISALLSSNTQDIPYRTVALKIEKVLDAKGAPKITFEEFEKAKKPGRN